MGLVGADKAQFGISYQEDVTYAHADGKEYTSQSNCYSDRNIILLDSPPYQTVTSIHQKDFGRKNICRLAKSSEEAVLKAVMEKGGGDFSKLTMVGSNGERARKLRKILRYQWYFEGWDMIKAKKRVLN